MRSRAWLALFIAGCTTEPMAINVITPRIPGQSEATGCSAKGCSVKLPDELRPSEIVALLRDYERAPATESSDALDTLLFHAPATRAYRRAAYWAALRGSWRGRSRSGRSRYRRGGGRGRPCDRAR